jgi:hypothetical protein
MKTISKILVSMTVFLGSSAIVGCGTTKLPSNLTVDTGSKTKNQNSSSSTSSSSNSVTNNNTVNNVTVQGSGNTVGTTASSSASSSSSSSATSSGAAPKTSTGSSSYTGKTWASSTTGVTWMVGNYMIETQFDNNITKKTPVLCPTGSMSPTQSQFEAELVITNPSSSPLIQWAAVAIASLNGGGQQEVTNVIDGIVNNGEDTMILGLDGLEGSTYQVYTMGATQINTALASDMLANQGAYALCVVTAQ